MKNKYEIFALMLCFVTIACVITATLEVKKTLVAVNDNVEERIKKEIADIVITTPEPANDIPEIIKPGLKTNRIYNLPEIIPEERTRDYTSDDIRYLTNMTYSEISAICYDNSYTEEEQNQAIQEWTCVVINQLDKGTADNIYDLFHMKTYPGSDYYIWHPAFTYDLDSFKLAMKSRGKFNDELYERCRINVMTALEGNMVEPLPADVIYADLSPHGAIYKTYNLNTGYYQSTVYLSYQ